MLDIDHFKAINDERGHLVGDTVIKRIAKIIADRARESDIVCRWGGEEFTILATDCILNDVLRLSDAIHEAMSTETFFITEPDRKITVSMGITQVKLGDDEKDIVARADKALYQAKDKGRNRTEAL